MTCTAVAQRSIWPTTMTCIDSPSLAAKDLFMLGGVNPDFDLFLSDDRRTPQYYFRGIHGGV